MRHWVLLLREGRKGPSLASDPVSAIDIAGHGLKLNGSRERNARDTSDDPGPPPETSTISPGFFIDPIPPEKCLTISHSEVEYELVPSGPRDTGNEADRKVSLGLMSAFLKVTWGRFHFRPYLFCFP
jgi:hypothetical protein